MRRMFGKVITELARDDNDIILVVGDIGYGIFDDFIKKFPERFFNVGICEQSMVGMAAGMALLGLKPYVYTITPFLIERAFEQIKLDIDQQDVNVKLVGYADYPKDGPTHAEVLTPKILNSIFTNLESYLPQDSKEFETLLRVNYYSARPVFFSLKRDDG